MRSGMDAGQACSNGSRDKIDKTRLKAIGPREPKQADWLKDALKGTEMKPRIPGRKAGKPPVEQDRRCDKRRNRIEFLSARVKGWRRTATRHDRCPKVILSAVALAATALFWL